MGNASAKPHPRSRNKKQVHWKAAERTRHADRPPPPGKPRLIDSSPDVVTIRWDPPKSDGGSPITGYLVEHRRTSSPHWVRATPTLTPFPELTLSGLEPGWRYQFRVSAENAVGISVPGELSEPLTVTLQRSVVTAPRFIEELKDTTALENEKVEFVAHFVGQPSPKVCWFKDGFEIFSSRRIRIITENETSALTIHQSALCDEGEIKCTATNRAGHASTKGKLTLEAPPSIRLPRQYEEGLLFELGEIIRLKVSIAGRPTPLVLWIHNGESIKSDDRYDIENTDKSSTLKINVAQRSDRGEYQVKAINKLGDNLTSFLVTVTDKPSPPGRARVVMTLGRSVTLSWGTPNDDGGCKIGNYIIEYYRVGWNVWLKAATCRQLTTILGDLIEGSEYKFRVKAESPYGVSEPSEESDVIFIPDPKRGLVLPPTRSRSQPRAVSPDKKAPVATARKRKGELRSQSSSRVETNGSIPIRPERSKIKSPPKTPDPSPKVTRKVNDTFLPENLMGRASMARELAYGSPDLKLKRNEDNLFTTKSMDGKKAESKIVNTIQVTEPQQKPSKSRSPSPNRVNNFRKSPSPAKLRERDIQDNDLTGSSEFMLVLYPDGSNRVRSSTSDMEFDFDENSIPPPMSLSAPELGSEFEFEPLRYSVSSTELLHERTMSRFYQAAAAEEAELEKRNKTTNKIPTIRINSTDQEDIERKLSFKRRFSGGSVPQQVLWAQKRNSLRHDDLTDVIANTLQKYPPNIEIRRHVFATRQRSKSEEEEEETFEKIRSRMASSKSGQVKLTERIDIVIVDEDKWDTESDEEEESEDSSSDEKIDDTVKLRDRYVEEDMDTYHPRMLSIKSSTFPKSKSDEPFEILTKPNPLPDPNFIPKPILKKRNEDELSDSFNEPATSQQKSVKSKLFASRDENTSWQRSLSEVPLNAFKEKSPVRNPTQRGSSASLPKNIATVAQLSGITAASVIIPETLLTKRKADEEVRVVVDHYGDLVRSYGHKKRNNPHLYLDRDELKAAAEEESVETKREIERSVENLQIPQEEDESNQERRNSLEIPFKSEERRNSLEIPGRRGSVGNKREASPTPKRAPSRSPNRDSKTKRNFSKSPIRSENWNVLRAPSGGLLQQRRSSLTVTKEPARPRGASPTPPMVSRKNSFPIRKDSLVSKVQLPSIVIDAPTLKNPPSVETRRDSSATKNQITESTPNPSVAKSTSASTSTEHARRPKMREITTQTSFGYQSFSPDSSRSSSPGTLTPLQEELFAAAEIKVRTTIEYITDLAMFAVACWLYLFSNELLAIPVLIVMVYRQLKDEVVKRLPKWMFRKKKDK